MLLNINQLAQKSCQGARSGSVPDIEAGRVTASLPACSAGRSRAAGYSLAAPRCFSGCTRDLRSPLPSLHIPAVA